MQPNNVLSSVHSDLLMRNVSLTHTWEKHDHDLRSAKEILSKLPNEMNHETMVPIGPRALMPGRIVHTNEFLVNLGNNYFVKMTASQSKDFCDRRLASCTTMLTKLQTERELFENNIFLPKKEDAFGNEDRPEIIEHVTEDEEKEWKKVHRQKEKEYRQKLADMRKEEKQKITNEEELWKRLDELELEEELEDELNRLHDGGSSDDDKSDITDATDSVHSDDELEEESEKKLDSTSSDGIESQNTLDVPKLSGRRVSFREDNFTNSDPLILRITHTKGTQERINTITSGAIISPADIYSHYVNLKASTPSSILKVKFNPNESLEVANCVKSAKATTNGHVPSKAVAAGIEIPGIKEKNVNSSNHTGESKNPQTRKISKFKAQRINR